MSSLKEKIDAAIALKVDCSIAKKNQKALQMIQSIKKGQEGKHCKSSKFFCIYSTTGLMTNWQYSCIIFWQCKHCGCYSFSVSQILDWIKQI